MGKKEEVDKRRGGKTISKSGQGWTLQAQLGQLKIKRGCCKVICGAPTTMKGYGIDRLAMDVSPYCADLSEQFHYCTSYF